MPNLNITADELVQILLQLSKTETVCFLDSCGVKHLGSHLLIAGIRPLEILEISEESTARTLSVFDQKLSGKAAGIFTVSYDFGLKLEKIKPRKKRFTTDREPDIFLAIFDCLIIHDYLLGNTFLQGNPDRFDEISLILSNPFRELRPEKPGESTVQSNFTRREYIKKVEKIRELIRSGETYQTNLTQQFRSQLAPNLNPQQIFWNLRTNHPAPFASFIKRKNDFVVSISPERFVNIAGDEISDKSSNWKSRIIQTSPIKGTRPRGKNLKEDLFLQSELISSEKDRAENTMIVDLLRNDLGRISEFGSIRVDKLCDLEAHPSLFHLVSTVSGILRNEISYADMIRAIFPCGSITGCPKIRTMEIIDQLETANRGLSMGAIGYSGFDGTFDMNVAIRTMVINNNQAVFNVGGGIVIDSNPVSEYEESLTKARALFNALGIEKTDYY